MADGCRAAGAPLQVQGRPRACYRAAGFPRARAVADRRFCELTADVPQHAAAGRVPAHFELRLVSANGGIRWQSGWVNVSHVLAGEYAGLEEIDDGEWDLYFGRMKLGRFHKRLRRVEDAQGRLARKRVKV